MNIQNRIFIGTSGWNYKHWRGTFYPADLAQKNWLGFYQKHFRTVEINNSFYHLPKKSTFESWKESTPKDFTFAVKASRYITHMKKLKDPEDALKKFFESVQGLGKKAGPILFQLPPFWDINPERLKNFLQALPKGHLYTFEFRNQTWWDNKIYKILEKHNAAFCIHELAGIISPKEATADFVYIRLHGPGAAYEGQYDIQTLSGWAGAFAAWMKAGKSVYCYFDNDELGYAAQDAGRLQEMVK